MSGCPYANSGDSCHLRAYADKTLPRGQDLAKSNLTRVICAPNQYAAGAGWRLIGGVSAKSFSHI